MLDEQQLREIRGWLEKAQNPVFFFDNDVDGLVSFLLLQRFIGRGRGVAIKSFPQLDKGYARKISEFKPDVIFILDKPMVDRQFFEAAALENIPIVWIDHHPLQETPENVYYYNPLEGEHVSSEPVSYLCYKVVRKDLWLAAVGCVSDCFIPDFMDEFRKKYPDLVNGMETAQDIFYKTELGKIATIFLFGLKDTTTNVVKMLRALEQAKDPYEILSGEKKYETMIKRYEFLNKKFEKLFEKADEAAKHSRKMVFFKYEGETKMSSEISNKLIYKYPDKIVIAANIHGEKANMSLRGMRVRMLLENALEKVEGRGGGHEEACAASVKADDLERFVDAIKTQL